MACVSPHGGMAKSGLGADIPQYPKAFVLWRSAVGAAGGAVPPVDELLKSWHGNSVIPVNAVEL